jgi:hypothetical protein
MPGPPFETKRAPHVDNSPNLRVLHSSSTLSSHKPDHSGSEYGPLSQRDSEPGVEREDTTAILSPRQSVQYANDYEGNGPGVDSSGGHLSQELQVSAVAFEDPLPTPHNSNRRLKSYLSALSMS